MARETVYRCDECGEYAAADATTQVLYRRATETTQNYKQGADLCEPCRKVVTVERVLVLAAAAQRAAEPAIETP